jgi:hypothetical protein
MKIDIYRWDEVHLPHLKKSPLSYMAQFKDAAKNHDIAPYADQIGEYQTLTS